MVASPFFLRPKNLLAFMVQIWSNYWLALVRESAVPRLLQSPQASAGWTILGP